MNNIRKFATTIAAATLTTGLVACSSEEDSAPVEVTATVTNTMSQPADDAMGSKGDTAGATGATVPATTADGAEVMIPAGLDEAIEKHADSEWGEPINFEETPNGWIATFDDGNYVTWNEATGGAPIWGEIANNWTTSVRAEDGLGFPLAPETEIADGSGWTQEFENGTMKWAREGTDGEFAADIKVN